MDESGSIIQMVRCSWAQKCHCEWQENITSVLSTFLLHMADAQQIFPVYWCPGAMVSKKNSTKSSLMSFTEMHASTLTLCKAGRWALQRQGLFP